MSRVEEDGGIGGVGNAQEDDGHRNEEAGGHHRANVETGEPSVAVEVDDGKEENVQLKVRPQVPGHDVALS